MDACLPSEQGISAPSDAAKNAAQINPWRPRLITNKVYVMDPSKENKENRDANQDIADSENLDLFPLILTSPTETKKSTKKSTCLRRCLPRFELSGWDVASRNSGVEQSRYVELVSGGRGAMKAAQA